MPMPTSASPASGLAALGPLINGLSPGCMGALGGMFVNPTSELASCLSLPDAISLFTGGGNSSVVPAFDTYLTKDICGKPPCSAQTLSGTEKAFHQACSDQDLAVNNGSNFAALFDKLIDNYAPFRDAACNANGATNQNCVVETMNSIESATKMPLTTQGFIGLLANASQFGQLAQVLAKNNNALCSDCNKAILTTVIKSSGIPMSQLAQVVNSSPNLGGLFNVTSQTCGASFVDGSIPTTTKNTSTSGASGNARTSANSNSAGVFTVPVFAGAALVVASASLLFL